MMPDVAIRMTGKQHETLLDHLYPGDEKEAVALLLAGRQNAGDRLCLSVRDVIVIPHDECLDRSQDEVRWPTTRLLNRLPDASRNGFAVIKIHSHPNGFASFSLRDDEADSELFHSIFGWMDSDAPHASLVMLPGGRIFGRAAWPRDRFQDLRLISIAGDDLKFWFADKEERVTSEAMRRNEQAFGKGTVRALQQLRVGVVGCSGTGSPVVEQLARLGVGELILVDPDFVEAKNLNRILNSTAEDAEYRRPKVEVLARAIGAMGLGTRVTALQDHLNRPRVVRALAACDLLFGCMDSLDGRQLLNRLSVFYSIPYFDVGVRLVADENGGVSNICGSVHYLQPDGSSLMSRGVVTEKQLRAEALRRNDPGQFRRLNDEGYIAGVAEDRPAVLPVNMLFASLAVNEFLARLHNYRLDPNNGYARLMLSLEQVQFHPEKEGDPCEALARHAGRGDVVPLLDLPSLSER